MEEEMGKELKIKHRLLNHAGEEGRIEKSHSLKHYFIFSAKLVHF